jgi:hypothetical protein
MTVKSLVAAGTKALLAKQFSRSCSVKNGLMGDASLPGAKISDKVKE